MAANHIKWSYKGIWLQIALAPFALLILDILHKNSQSIFYELVCLSLIGNGMSILTANANVNSTIELNF